GRGRPCGWVATSLRDWVEPRAGFSLVSARAGHSTVVARGDGDRRRRNQALALRDRWGAGDQVEGPGAAPAPGQLRWSVAEAGCGKGRRVLVSARTVRSPGRRGWKGSASLRGYASGRQNLLCPALGHDRRRRTGRRWTPDRGGVGRGPAPADGQPGAGQAQEADLQARLAHPEVRPGHRGPGLGPAAAQTGQP